MALTMHYINDVLRMFPTDVVVREEDWPDLMRLLKFPVDRRECTLDRMTLRPVVGGYAGLLDQLRESHAIQQELLAKSAELSQQLAQATAPVSAL